MSETVRARRRYQIMRKIVLGVVGLALSSCVSGPLPIDSRTPAPSGTFASVVAQMPGFQPPGCVSVRVEVLRDESLRSEWLCDIEEQVRGGAAFSQAVRAAANAQGWRECTPGLFFVRGDTVMTIQISTDPNGASPGTAPTSEQHREVRVVVAESRRVAATC